jgi:Spy/CpxP family protein refolding chaperone
MDHDMASNHECGCMQKQDGHEQGFKKFPWMLKKKLGLTGKQAGEISDIMEAEHAKAKPLFGAVHKERKTLMDVAKGGDQTAIKTQAGKLADAEAALAVHHAAVHKRIAAVMTKEQAEKFEKMADEFDKHGKPSCHKKHDHHEMKGEHSHHHDDDKND